MARPTFYAWAGEHSAIPPEPNKAATIARFIGADTRAVKEALLRANGHLDDDEYIAVRVVAP